MAYHTTQFRPTRLSRALTLAGLVTLLGATTTINAQENRTTPPQEDDIEVITVTGGFRGSLASALNQKRFETGSTDSIKAEDIADFPDLNLAESLQRIPGVAITRAAGEGRQISVRGLGPEFTRVRINGMEALSTSGGTDQIGGANRGRGFDFNTFSSDLFSELTVRKTASADVEEGSLGATVDLRTARPFDYDGFTFAANVQAGYNDLSEEVDPKGSFLVSNIFADGKFGALFSMAMSERNIKDQGASTVRWNNVNDFNIYRGNSGATVAPELQAINDGFRPRLPRYDSYTHNVKRTGAAAAFEYRPSAETRFNLDILYAKDDSTRSEIFSQAILNGNAQTGRMNVLDYEVDGSNTVTYAAFEDATIRNESRYDELGTEFLQFTLSAQHQLTDNLKIDGQIGRAKSEFSNPVQTTVVMEKIGVDFSYDYRGGKRQNPELLFGSNAYETDNWSINSLRIRPLGAENTFDNAAFNLEYTLNDSLKLRSGVNYKKFDFDTYEARLGSESGLVGTPGIAMPENLITTHDSGMGSGNAWLVPDLNAFAAAYNIYSNSGDYTVSIDNRRADNYSAKEKSTAAYLQLAFDTEIGDTTVRGDIGGRYVKTEQSSTAWATLGGSTNHVLITADHSYNEFLPSLNLVFEPMDDVIIRFGYAEVMARAGLGSIRPNVSVSASGGSRTITGGNPTLEPTKAKTYDLGLELYFDNESLLGIAVFRKDIDSYVQNLRETKMFSETGLPVQAAIDACTAGPGYGTESGCNENVEWQTTTPLNGPGGDLYGYEIQYQMPFSFLPEFWDRFGFIGNFTYVKAQMDYINNTGTILATRDLQGLSENTRSATLYYEDEKFSARVSLTDRSSYLTNAIGRDNNDMEGANATRNIDAAMSYQLTERWKISFEALNLTDEVDDQWVDSSGNRLTYYHSTGRQYYLGAQYRF